ncbi:alpha/beta fold hydrolase [Streptomyces cinnamoneus]|uniref:alpha/beta fold hydrolase n=1 Tax=Streptomyces cinnamoneus TaxID=53446 RepID=UPI0034357E33
MNVFGACFGAAIALRFAQRHPDRIARLMLGGTAVEISPEYAAAARRWRRMVDEGRFDDMARDMVEQFMAPPRHGVVRRRAAVARLMLQRFAHLTDRELAMDITHHERLLTHAWSLAEPAVTCPVKDSDHLVQIERDGDLADLMTRLFTDRSLDDLPYLNPVEHFAKT